MSLEILNNMTLTVLGNTYTAKQGAITDDFSDVKSLTVTGLIHSRTGSIATSTVATVFDSANDLPATFLYAHVVCDQTVYIQIIGSATHAIVKVAAGVPFVIPGVGSVLGVASTTVIVSEPSLTAVAKIVIGNYSGNTANYTLNVIL